jgi:hypothetical protein
VLTVVVLCAVQTPSLIPPALLERILDTLQQQYSISPSAEISMEADPGTFDLPRLQQYRALGVNRLSMGVQCFDQVSKQTSIVNIFRINLIIIIAGCFSRFLVHIAAT